MKKITVISLGGWGMALACLLTKNGHDVTIWGRSKEKVDYVNKTKEHPEYLPGIKLPFELKITNSIQQACDGTEIFISTTPSDGLRKTMSQFAPFIKKDTIIVNGAKGIEEGTFFRLSQVIEDILPHCRTASLSGPGHAEEVARGLPTTYVVASKFEGVAEEIQDVFMSPVFRVYRNADIIGVELGGALKNVIALAAGISDGMGYGDNAKAALMTRGISEIARLGGAMGANVETFAGLSGIGDLIVTCTSMHSRNRRAGILLGQGKSLQQTLDEVHMVVEGVKTAQSAYQLGLKYNVDLPIINEIHKTLFEGADPKKAVNNLMLRDKTQEHAKENPFL